MKPKPIERNIRWMSLKMGWGITTRAGDVVVAIPAPVCHSLPVADVARLIGCNAGAPFRGNQWVRVFEYVASQRQIYRPSQAVGIQHQIAVIIGAVGIMATDT
jgi:hypothetical protein